MFILNLDAVYEYSWSWHWVKFFPVVNLQNGCINYKMQPERGQWEGCWLNCPFNIHILQFFFVGGHFHSAVSCTLISKNCSRLAIQTNSS